MKAHFFFFCGGGEGKEGHTYTPQTPAPPLQNTLSHRPAATNLRLPFRVVFGLRTLRETDQEFRQSRSRDYWSSCGWLGLDRQSARQGNPFSSCRLFRGSFTFNSLTSRQSLTPTHHQPSTSTTPTTINLDTGVHHHQQTQVENTKNGKHNFRRGGQAPPWIPRSAGRHPLSIVTANSFNPIIIIIQQHSFHWAMR